MHVCIKTKLILIAVIDGMREKGIDKCILD